jgi:uncharacterized protein
MQQANGLINELSPYLLQHAYNPVNWVPWSEAAFKEAQERDVPVLVSIGYSACHWCHVMERESFEHPDTAALMNENFVCIKVDREEHPDVDHMYMDAVQAISGAGGWPLNVFTTPTGVPLYGGTYYPPVQAYSRPSWPAVLTRIADLWQHNRGELLHQAEQLMAFMKQSMYALHSSNEGEIDITMIETVTAQLLRLADKVYGGFGNAPKFPATMAINYLLAHHGLYGSEAALQVATKALGAMHAGGIYDHLAGGFARYSTDKEWLAPHFEKMLYDNALLIGSYVEAFQLTKQDQYQRIAAEVAAFVMAELQSEDGGFLCALDADSEGIEGKYYTWSMDELQTLLSGDAELVAAYYGVTNTGNWDHTNILHLANDLPSLSKKFTMAPEEAISRIERARAVLLKARASRVRPATDDKILLSWNALMNIALSQLASLPGGRAYETAAIKHIDWLKQHFYKNGKWHRVWKNGIPKIDAKLDDIAFFAQACLQCLSYSQSEAQLQLAEALIELAEQDFAGENGYYYYTPVWQTDIPIRKQELYDGATPSANAVMAHNLWLAGTLLGKFAWIEKAKRMVLGMLPQLKGSAYSHCYWAKLMQLMHSGLYIAICCGNGAREAAEGLRSFYLPQLWVVCAGELTTSLPILGGKVSSGDLKIYLCTEFECKQPTNNVNDVLVALRSGFKS